MSRHSRKRVNVIFVQIGFFFVFFFIHMQQLFRDSYAATCTAESNKTKLKYSLPFRSYSCFGTVRLTEIFASIQVYTQNASS